MFLQCRGIKAWASYMPQLRHTLPTGRDTAGHQAHLSHKGKIQLEQQAAYSSFRQGDKYGRRREKYTCVQSPKSSAPPPYQRNVNVNVTQKLLLLDESGAYDQVQRRQRMTTATLKGDQGSLAPANGCQMPGGKAAISTGQREVKP